MRRRRQGSSISAMTRPPSSRLMRSMPVRSAATGCAGALSYCASADRVCGGEFGGSGSSGGADGICTAAGALALRLSGPPWGLRGAPGVLASCAADIALIRRVRPVTEVSTLIRSRSAPLVANPLASPSRGNSMVSTPSSTECTVALLSSIQATRRLPLTASRISGQRCRRGSTSEDAPGAGWPPGAAAAGDEAGAPFGEGAAGAEAGDAEDAADSVPGAADDSAREDGDRPGRGGAGASSGVGAAGAAGEAAPAGGAAGSDETAGVGLAAVSGEATVSEGAAGPGEAAARDLAAEGGGRP